MATLPFGPRNAVFVASHVAPHAAGSDARVGDAAGGAGPHRPLAWRELPLPAAQGVQHGRCSVAARDEISPLNQLTGAAKKAAQAKNNAFIAQRRRNARELLRRAYLEEGFVPSWGLSSVQIAAFSPSGSVTNPIFITASSDEEED